MYKATFGKRRVMKFSTQEQYFETLGFLAKADGSTLIYRENNQNQGAWAHEVRMNCFHSTHKFPKPLFDKFTKGRGKNIKERINCNEFFEDLVSTHNFVLNAPQNYTVIRTTIPQQYLVDFDRGYNL